MMADGPFGTTNHQEGQLVMVSTLTEPLSGVLHELLTARSLRERNRELVLALVTAGNRGEVNQLTRHWTGSAGAGGERCRTGWG